MSVSCGTALSPLMLCLRRCAPNLFALDDNYRVRAIRFSWNSSCPSVRSVGDDSSWPAHSIAHFAEDIFGIWHRKIKHLKANYSSRQNNASDPFGGSMLLDLFFLLNSVTTLTSSRMNFQWASQQMEFARGNSTPFPCGIWSNFRRTKLIDNIRGDR